MYFCWIILIFKITVEIKVVILYIDKKHLRVINRRKKELPMIVA